MKKLYIGLGISAALIVGGIAYSAYARPTVNMATMGKYYYQKRDFRNDLEGKANVIYGDQDKLKLKIKLDDFSGGEEVRNLIYKLKDREYKFTKQEQKMFDKYMSQGADEKKEPKILLKEIIKYKWTNPVNITLAKDEGKKIKYRDGGDGYSNLIKPILDSDRVSLSGSIVMNRKQGFNEELFIYGVRGSGTLELEFEAVYK
ncbi:hypothetical protein [Clostridium cylindrosporum]|uniref:Uncharacterized protein n=1 Tax=Clostridium cylindrosporum DSM 605 TaxID=1121307 RepID=A0A0J8D963_CLOCY|nr:hypothetical protein [Clostridium cylindrosporum]KMT22407.1 hypothetical protein CLCY_14c00050 [Clostridium cylindrosporum DSM 605]